MGLTAQQVDAVLQESLHRKFFELDVDGGLPRDAGDRAKAAEELLRQCRLSYSAGNRLEGVTALLHIAEDELVSAQPNRDTGGSMATAEAQVDLSAHPLETLKKFETTLLGHPQETEDQAREVQENLALVRAEIARKTGSSPQPAQAIASAVAQEAASTSLNGNSGPHPEVVHADEVVLVDRAALEDQLSFKIMRAHEIDPSDVPSITDDQLQWILAHPEGSGTPAVSPAPTPVATPAVPQPDQSEIIETTRMVINRDPEPVPATPPPEPTQDAPKSDLDPEREELEGQVTGPLLKAYGRGRTDVPGLGINELRFMIQNPEGRVTAEQLAAAKALDEDADGAAQATPPEPAIAETEPAQKVAVSPEMVVTKEVLGPEQVDHFLPQDATATNESIPVSLETVQVSNSRMTKSQALGTVPPANPAQEIIDREQFPTPPEIDGKPPRLPFDMSKLDDDSLRSLHAQMHAVHSRANYIVGIWEGELRDIVKLRKGEEVTAANNAPTKDPDDSRKRLTDAQREALVAATPEVVALKEREHDIERILRQLRTLRDGYSSDVSTCSRQWAMRKEESNGAVAR